MKNKMLLTKIVLLNQELNLGSLYISLNYMHTATTMTIYITCSLTHRL